MSFGKPARTTRVATCPAAYEAAFRGPTFVTLALAGFGGGRSEEPRLSVRFVKVELHGELAGEYDAALAEREDIYTMDSGKS